MPINLLPTIAKFAGKQILNWSGKKAYSTITGDDLGYKSLNDGEEDTMELLKEYQKPNSPLSQNVSEADFLHELSDNDSPLYKDISDWTNADLAKAYNSPLYKYHKKLQNKADEYVRTKWNK